MTAALPTFEDFLLDQGKDASGSFRCSRCDGVHPAFAFVRLGDTSAFECSDCHVGDLRNAASDAAAADRAARVAVDPWDCEDGATAKACRNARIEMARWAVDRDTSPLTEACQEDFRCMIRVLHRITIDFAAPADVIWPAGPALSYAQP